MVRDRIRLTDILFRRRDAAPGPRQDRNPAGPGGVDLLIGGIRVTLPAAPTQAEASGVLESAWPQ
jgi:hypothetical protein